MAESIATKPIFVMPTSSAEERSGLSTFFDPGTELALSIHKDLVRAKPAVLIFGYAKCERTGLASRESIDFTPPSARLWGQRRGHTYIPAVLDCGLSRFQSPLACSTSITRLSTITVLEATGKEIVVVLMNWDVRDTRWVCRLVNSVGCCSHIRYPPGRSFPDPSGGA